MATCTLTEGHGCGLSYSKPFRIYISGVIIFYSQISDNVYLRQKTIRHKLAFDI